MFLKSKFVLYLISQILITLLFFLALFVFSINQNTNSKYAKFFGVGNKNVTVNNIYNKREFKLEEALYEEKIPDRNIQFAYSSFLGLYDNQYVGIDWNYDSELLQYGELATICLVAFDSNSRLLDAKIKVDDDCSYRFGGLHFSLNLGSVSIKDKTLEVKIPAGVHDMFISQPDFYAIEIILMDQRPTNGLTEWAGMVGYAESKKIWRAD